MNMANFIIVLLALCCTVLTTQALLHPDQVGERDWSKEHLGVINYASYSGKYLTVGTKSGVLARLMTRTGTVQWRTVFPGEERVDVLGAHKKTIFTFSEKTMKASMWQSVDGSLLWDTVLGNNLASSSSPSLNNAVARIIEDVDIDEDGIDDIVVVVRGKIFLVSGARGKVLWQQDLVSNFDVQLIKINSIPSQNENTLILVGYTTDQKLASFIDINLQNGEYLGDATLNLVDRKNKSIDLVDLSGNKFCILKGNGDLSYYSLDDKMETAFGGDRNSYKNFMPVGRDAGILNEHPGVVVVEFNGGYDLYRLNENNNMEIFKSYTTKSKVKYGFGLMKSKKNNYYVVAAKLKDENAETLYVDVFDLSSKVDDTIKSKELSFATSKSSYSYAKHGTIDQIIPTIIESKKNGKRRCRIFFNTKSDDNFMLENDNELWKKDEALANIANLVVVNRHDSTDDKCINEAIPTLATRLELQLEQLLSLGNKIGSTFSTLAAFASKKLQETLQPGSKDNSGPKSLSKAESQFFGFYKVIVVMTKCGKIVGLDSTTGDTIWTNYFPEETSYGSSGITKNRDIKVFVSRRETVGGKVPQVIAVARDMDTKSLSAYFMDASNGKIIFTEKVNDAITDMFILPNQMQRGSNILLLVGSNDKLIILPRKSSGKMSSREFLRQYEKIHFSSVSRDELSVNGYGAMLDEDTDELKRYKLWSVQFPKATDGTNKIAAISSSESSNGGLNSPVHILGDDSLMLKYLNPHLLAVALVTSETSDSGILKQGVTISLIDAVTGRVVQRFFHKNCAGPVKVTQSENWVFYSYWNLKARRTEIGSIALYDGAIDSHALNPWTTLPKILQDENKVVDTSFSSYDSEQPVILQKTFIFPSGITTLSGVHTLAGVTEKQLLIGTINGQIYSLDRRFLDPRRPAGKPSKSDQSEGLMPYAPVLPVMTQNVLSYTKEIERLNAIVSVPAGLESTTLVLGYGLDIFFTRAMPSQGFDILPEEFQWELLVLIITALFVGQYVARTSLEKQMLGRQWK
jgi:ER membrane protein complex subunit 1